VDYIFAHSKDALTQKVNAHAREGFGAWAVDGEPEAYNSTNYCTNLNAMHEAENTAIFPAARGMVYGRELQRVCSEEGPIQCGQTQWERWSFSATARQRAEAFLRTIGKWHQSPVEKE
jgi:hypothetical protein